MKYEFTNQNGETLSGNLELPQSNHQEKTQPKALVIFAHCFTCNQQVIAAQVISKQLSTLGFGVLRFDFTGLGSSTGDFSNSNYSSNVDDIVAASKALTKTHTAPSVLVGHSLGGSAVLAASLKLNDIKSVVTIGAPADPVHVSHLFSEHQEKILETGEAEVDLAGRKFTIKKQFLSDLESQNFLSLLKDTKKNYLIMHSPTDQIVGIDNAAKIFTSLKHPKSFVSLQTDHLISDRKSAKYIAEMIAAWLLDSLQLELEIETSQQPKLIPQNQEVKVANGIYSIGDKSEMNYYNHLYSKSHHLAADEPTDLGGNNLAPSPNEFLLMALNSCTAITLRMYANRKKWNLDSIEVHCYFEGEGQNRHIERKVTLNGNLDEEERVRLIEIANKCPIHKLLAHEIEVKTSEQ